MESLSKQQCRPTEEVRRESRNNRVIGVANRDYHYLSRFEIDGAKRIYQHLISVLIMNRTIGLGGREVWIA
ncbi:MAG: hypothetical protein WCC03_07240, partial [Candidatus Acidiferrales bacterium]